MRDTSVTVKGRMADAALRPPLQEGEWGQTKYRRHKVELVLTRESVKRLVEMLEGGSNRKPDVNR